VHGLREIQRTGLARKIIDTSPSISPPSPLHTLHTRTASKKVAVTAHHLHLDALSVLASRYYYYTCIYNAHTFSSGTESETLAVTRWQRGKGVDGLFEKVSFQVAFEGVESG